MQLAYSTSLADWAVKQEVISTLRGKRLKLVDQFMYFGKNILLTESDVNICLVKTWNAIDRLLIIKKSYLPDKMSFLPSCTNTTVWMHHMGVTETM